MGNLSNMTKVSYKEQIAAMHDEYEKTAGNSGANMTSWEIGFVNGRCSCENAFEERLRNYISPICVLVETVKLTNAVSEIQIAACESSITKILDLFQKH